MDAIIQIRISGVALNAILEAVTPLVPVGQVEILKRVPFPESTEEEKKSFESLAQQVASVVAPTAKQPMRREALRAAITGWDTFWDQKGESDTPLRNAMGALSKALKAVFPFEASPIDRLATRSKHFDPTSGHYLGTAYTPTDLGRRVKQILVEKGQL